VVYSTYTSTIGLSSKAIELETANNTDLTFLEKEGDIGFIFNIFYNSVDNYYYQVNTVLVAEAGHNQGENEHGEEEHVGEEHDAEDGEHNGDEHGGELPVFLFKTDNVILHGFEAQIAWQLSNEFKATVFSDFVRARLKSGADSPRTPPLRFGSQFSYQIAILSAHLDTTRYQSQDRIVDFETKTDSYTLVDISISYDLPILNNNIAVYFKGNNLTDTEARVHTSFLQDLEPRSARKLSNGVRGYF
jgi:iron complex outermembrane receptor protein